MYSWEIDSYFRRKNYTFDSYKELQIIQECSPQIDRIRLKSLGEYSSKYFVSSSDGYWWDIDIKNIVR